MRQIKFRGLRTDGEGWVYGYYWFDNQNKKHKITSDLSDDNFRCHEVIQESVGQFTGLHDVYSCEIYEGDLLSLCGKIIGNIHESLDERESYIIIPEITGRDWQSAYKKILDITQGNT